jgi:hypothetical protein
MAIPREEEKKIQNTLYKIKHLPASKGWLYLLKLSRLVFSGANSLSEILQRPEVQKLFGNLSSNNFEITEKLLAKLSPNIAEKLQGLKNQVYLSIDLFQSALLSALSDEEFSQFSVMLTMQAAVARDESNANISISSHILQFVSSLMLDLDAEALSLYIEQMINSSVQRYREGEGQWTSWKHEGEKIYAFDNHFAGRYNEMLELFVYLLIFNYAESVLMIKKNQIMNDLRPILDQLIPKLDPSTDEST